MVVMNMDVKESTRKMYGFGDDHSFKTFDTFYDGLIYTARGDLVKAISALNEVIESIPTNPYPYQFRVLIGKDKGESPEKLLPICEKWLNAAKFCDNDTQIQRAQFSYDFYKGTDQEREDSVKKFKDLFKKSLQERSNV